MDPRVELDHIKAKMKISDAILMNRIFTNNCDPKKIKVEIIEKFLSKEDIKRAMERDKMENVSEKVKACECYETMYSIASRLEQKRKYYEYLNLRK